MLTDTLRAQIAARKQELLEFLRNQKQSSAFVPPPILRRTSGEPAPLSFAQERLWFLEQLEPGSTVYNIYRALRLAGNLNVPALESSLNEIVRRHEVLRSLIRIVDGRPIQVVTNEFRVKLAISDLQHLSGNECDVELQRRIREEVFRRFDFSAGVFLRAILLRVAANEHFLILTTHHMMSDAWSMGILTRELWTLYEAFAKDEISPLEDLPIQYSDYAALQRQGEVIDSQVAYWKKQLAGIPLLNLPTEGKRPAQQTFRGARVPIILPESLTAGVNDLSHRCSVTPFMTLLATFQVLLYRYSGETDIVVGSAVANRNRRELEPLIGFFVNTLVLRSNLSGNPSFAELLTRVRDVCLGAYAHQDLPFEKMIEELKPERDLSRSPLFQVMFVLQNATKPMAPPRGIRAESIEIDTAQSQFDLSLFLRERGEKYIGYIEYNTDLFNHDRIERMVGNFQILLEGIIGDPERTISTLPILTDLERQQILVEWNDTTAEYPKDKCIHELFEEQAERTPRAIAVEFEDQKLTYEALNRRANQLARHLITLGVGPEELVGICLDRSLDLVVGLLGILKAGGAYVPLDPTYPKERLAFMLDSARVSVIVTQRRLIELTRVLLRPQSIVCLDANRSVIDQNIATNPRIEANSKNLMYVIFTSGSTGKPKGVQVEHRSVVNCLVSINRQVEIGSRDRLLAITTISFDIAALEIYLPLVVGARVVVCASDDSIDGIRLRRRLLASKATVMQATPSTWKLLLGGGWKRNKNLKLLSGGEVLSPELADRLVTQGCGLWNLYGPTETTIWSTVQKLESNAGPVSIGRPIGNTKLYVLDANFQLVPVGVAGELYIAGNGLARGYLHNSELTKEKFISNPFKATNSPIYRTGDLVRYLSTGKIEWLGRIDRQVKIRGHRVELSEIERVLGEHSFVKDCVVVTDRGNAADEHNLVAYIVPKDQSALPIPELRGFLRAKLPAFMVPTDFFVLETLPLTPNGKIDRNRLPVADKSNPEIAQELGRTQIEELVAQIWRDVLKIDAVEVDANFFDLGGHSLSATRVVARVQEVFQRTVSVRDVFEAPTVSGFGQIIMKTSTGKGQADFPPIIRVPRYRSFSLSIAQQQVWALEQLFPGTLFLNMPYAFRLLGPLHFEILRKSIQEVIRRHEAFHMVFKEKKGRPVQIVGRVPRAEIPVIDLRRLGLSEAEKEYHRLSIEDAELPLDLAEGPPFRIQLVRFADQNHVLLVTVHHIICDHWSMQLFRHELIALYESYLQGRSPSLPQVSFQLIDYVCWQNTLLKRGFLNSQMVYWKKQLLGRPSRMEFRKKGKRKGQLGFGTKYQSLETKEAFLRDLKSFALKEGSSTFMVLLAMVSIVLHRYTGQSEVRIGTTVANRGRRETKTLICNCLNAVILRVSVFPRMSFRRLLQQIRATTLDALANQDVPFGQLARTFAKRKSATDACLFEVMFIYQNREFEPRKVAGLTFAGWEGDYRRAEKSIVLTSLDLIFDLREASTKLTGTVTYKTAVIENDLVTGMIRDFQWMSQALISQPDRRISAILSDKCVNRME